LQIPETHDDSFSLNEEIASLRKSEGKEKLLIIICLDEPSLAPGLPEEEATKLKKEYKENATPLFGALRRHLSDKIDEDLISIEYYSPYTTSQVSQVSIFQPYKPDYQDHASIPSFTPDLPYLS